MLLAVDTDVLTALATAVGAATALAVGADFAFRRRRMEALRDATHRAAENADRLRRIVAAAPDLSTVNLPGLDLGNLVLRERQLRDADLSRSLLRETDLRGADCTRAILRSSDLTAARCARANFTEADLGSALLSGTDLTGAILVRCNLRDADLRGAILDGADFSGALLMGADLRGTELEKAITAGADLTDARLPSGNLRSRLPTPSEESGLDAGPLIPVYVVVDVSASMAGAPIEALTAQIGELLLTMRDDPLLAEKVAISVIAFADRAEVVLPMVPVGDAVLSRPLKAAGGTAYGPAFALLRSQVAADLARFGSQGRGFHRPIAFFVSDGTPTDVDWKRELKELLAVDQSPAIVAVGIGSAEAETMRRVGSAAAFISDRASLVEAIRAIGTLAAASVRSMEAGGELRVTEPSGFFIAQ